MRWDTVPEGDPQPGIYAFGYDDELRYGLNKKKGLMSYTRLKRFVDPTMKVSPFVAGVGNLVSDRLLFGPDCIPGRYYFHDENVKFNTKIGMAWKKQFEAENPGVTIIRPRQREEAERLIEAALADPDVRAGLDAKGIPEAGIVANINGVTFRAWLDKLMPNSVMDIKTTRCATPEEFIECIVKYGYDAQAALYLTMCRAIGLDINIFRWAVISKTSGRAWVQELDARDFFTGYRWVKDNASLYTRFGLLEDQLRETIEQGGVAPSTEGE
jgi:hypothetical protein